MTIKLFGRNVGPVKAALLEYVVRVEAGRENLRAAREELRAARGMQRRVPFRPSQIHQQHAPAGRNPRRLKGDVQ